MHLKDIEQQRQNDNNKTHDNMRFKDNNKCNNNMCFNCVMQQRQQQKTTFSEITCV